MRSRRYSGSGRCSGGRPSGCCSVRSSGERTACTLGTRTAGHFRRSGVPPARLFPTPYCVDNSYFEERAATLALDRPRLRLNFGITDDAPVVLFCGKFNEQKQPLLLLEAFERVRAPGRLLAPPRGRRGRFVLLPRKSSLSAVSQTFVSLAS